MSLWYPGKFEKTFTSSGRKGASFTSARSTSTILSSRSRSKAPSSSWMNPVNPLHANFNLYSPILDRAIFFCTAVLWTSKTLEYRKNFLACSYTWLSDLRSSCGSSRYSLISSNASSNVALDKSPILCWSLKPTWILFSTCSALVTCWRMVRWFLNVDLRTLLSFASGRLKGFQVHRTTWT